MLRPFLILWNNIYTFRLTGRVLVREHCFTFSMPPVRRNTQPLKKRMSIFVVNLAIHSYMYHIYSVNVFSINSVEGISSLIVLHVKISFLFYIWTASFEMLKIVPKMGLLLISYICWKNIRFIFTTYHMFINPTRSTGPIIKILILLIYF